eukprot:1982788-Pyramimonas_sp.AAC.1
MTAPRVPVASSAGLNTNSTPSRRQSNANSAPKRGQSNVTVRCYIANRVLIEYGYRIELAEDIGGEDIIGVDRSC